MGWELNWSSKDAPYPFILLLLILIPLAAACATTQEKDWEGVNINGEIVDDGGNPVEGVYVYAYREIASNTLGPADAMSEPTGADGVYILTLPEGSYTLVARKRLSGSISGPLRNGDMSGQFPKPVRAGPGHQSGVNMTLRVFRQGQEGDPKRTLATHTRVQGVIIDPDGRVLENAYAFAYRGAFRPDPPDYLAPATGADGRFEISLPEGGSYTIGARTGLRGKPRADDSMGFWGGKDRLWKIEEGSVTVGVRIVVVPYGDTVIR